MNKITVNGQEFETYTVTGVEYTISEQLFNDMEEYADENWDLSTDIFNKNWFSMWLEGDLSEYSEEDVEDLKMCDKIINTKGIDFINLQSDF